MTGVPRSLYAPASGASAARRRRAARSFVFTMAGVLFEDIFNVKDIDPEGKKFDRGEFTFT